MGWPHTNWDNLYGRDPRKGPPVEDPWDVLAGSDASLTDAQAADRAADQQARQRILNKSDAWHERNRLGVRTPRLDMATAVSED